MNTISSQSHQEYKKIFAQVYNRVNQEIHGVGVKKQRIEFIDEKVMIFAQHKRVQSLKTLSQHFHHLTISVDSALIVEFKLLLKGYIEERLPFKVKTILKDYDPISEEACTIIYFDNFTF